METEKPTSANVSVEQRVRRCVFCKWGESINRNATTQNEARCHWYYRNRDTLPQLPFYATVCDKENPTIYGTDIGHWFPRWVKDNDAEKCKTFENASA